MASVCVYCVLYSSKTTIALILVLACLLGLCFKLLGSGGSKYFVTLSILSFFGIHLDCHCLRLYAHLSFDGQILATFVSLFMRIVIMFGLCCFHFGVVKLSTCYTANYTWCIFRWLCKVESIHSLSNGL